DTDTELGRDLDHHVVVVQLGDPAVDSARRHDLDADVETGEHLARLELALLLGPHDDEVQKGERDDDEEEAWAAHGMSSFSVGRASRASASALHDAKAPRSIACRAAATRSSKKRRLCRLRSRRPRISCWLTRWRMYARVKCAHAGQAQPSSRGPASRAKRALRRLRRPSQVSALPVRAVRVGRTQSNMSTPREITSITPSGSPIPMK